MTKPKKSQRKRIMRNTQVSHFPPNYSAVPTYRRKFRFVSQTASTKGSNPVTSGSLFGLQYLPQAVNAGISLYSSVKLVEVEVFSGTAPAGAVDSFSQLNMEWVGDRCPNINIGAAGNEIVPAHIKTRPPKQSFAAMWISSSDQKDPNNILFEVTGPAGTVCDVTIDYQVLDPGAVSGQADIVMAAVLSPGFVFVNAFLDNTSKAFVAGSNNWLIQNILTASAAYCSSF